MIVYIVQTYFYLTLIAVYDGSRQLSLPDKKYPPLRPMSTQALFVTHVGHIKGSIDTKTTISVFNVISGRNSFIKKIKIGIWLLYFQTVTFSNEGSYFFMHPSANYDYYKEVRFVRLSFG